MGKKLKAHPGILPIEEHAQAVLFLCGKCQSKLGHCSYRRDLKDELKHRGLAKRVRVVEASCMKLCPKGGVTACALGPGGGPRFAVLGGKLGPDDLLDWLLAEEEAA